ncbi:MAG: hypothetical protein QOH71_3647 [Blastocatellia bacterium]|jgi:hypothetical protein|nr:hypothetical protein [Blastocatellia bacterium]
MENTNGHDDSRDFLFFAGGLALMVLGAGLIAANPTVRKAIAKGVESALPDLQKSLGGLVNVTSVGDDIQRYMRLRAM